MFDRAASQPASAPPDTASHVTASRGVTPFFVLVFGSTWLFQLPALLAERGVVTGPVERFMPLVVLGFFGPLLVALALCARESKPALRALWRPLSIWRVSIGWYALGLGLPCAIFLAVRALAALFGNESDPWFYPPSQAQQIAALLLIPLTEQLPWRGYLYPRLQASHGPLLASLITGFAWALFHVQKHAFIDPNASLELALLTLAFMTSGTVIFSWIYLRTGGSLLLVVIAHAGAYLNNPTSALPNTAPLALHTAGYCVAALALLLVDRAIWRRAPSETAAAPD